MFVKPKAGLVIRDPISKVALPPEGDEVPDTTYWHRRLRSGDVVSAIAPSAAPVVSTNQIPDSSESDEG